MVVYDEVRIDMSVEDIYHGLSTLEKSRMYNLIKNNGVEIDIDELFNIRSVEDQIKLDLLQEIFKTKSLTEIEEFCEPK